MTTEEIPPLQRSPELSGMEDLAEKLQVAEALVNHGRDPRLAEFALRAPGADVPAKVRAFEKMWDNTVSKVVDERFTSNGRAAPSGRVPGICSSKEFIDLAKQAQDESIPVAERDSLIAEMMTALRQGRVR